MNVLCPSSGYNLDAGDSFKIFVPFCTPYGVTPTDISQYVLQVVNGIGIPAVSEFKDGLL
jgi:hypothetical protein